MKKPLLMDLEDNVTLEGDVLVVIDRRRLPREIVRLVCPDYEAVARAIEDMAWRSSRIPSFDGRGTNTLSLPREAQTRGWHRTE